MKNNLLKRIAAIDIISYFIVFIFLFGCENSNEHKTIQKTTFDPIFTQQQFESKSTNEKWEILLEIVSTKYSNQDQVDAFLVKNSPSLFSDGKNVPKNILNEINTTLYDTEVSQAALLFAAFTLKHFNSDQTLYLQGFAAATLSNHYQVLKLYDNVNKYNLILKRAIQFDTSDRLKVIYFTNNANALKEKGFLFESAVNYRKALGLIDPIDSLTQFTLNTNLASIYYELNYPDKAKVFIDSATTLVALTLWSIESLNLAGLVFSKTTDFDKAEDFFSQAINVSLQDGNPFHLAQSYANFANFNRKIKKYSTAFQYMAKSDSICRELQLDFGILINRINRAELYYELKNFQKAQLELVQVEKDLPQYKNPKLQIDYYELSYRLYDAIGNSQLANSMFRAYTEKKEQYFGDLPRSIIAEWELASKNEKSIQESTTFKLQKEQQSKEKYIIILVSALLLLAFLLFYLIRNRKNILEREKINKEKQLIKFDLELKSKQLVSESLKSITIQNTKEELLHQLEEVIQELPKIHHTKFQQIIHNLKLNRTSSLLSEFEARFTGVYEQYYDKLKTIAPDLTPHELRICALMRLNIPTKEIAILTNRTTGTVDNTRSTIRKKLKLEDETNLQDYLLKL